MAWSVQFDKSLSIDETDRLMRRAELCWQHYVEFASQLKALDRRGLVRQRVRSGALYGCRA